jgi:DnaJ-class molecular chaperone
MRQPIIEQTFRRNQNVICGFCKGTGSVYGEICTKCDGNGMLERETEGTLRLYKLT